MASLSPLSAFTALPIAAQFTLLFTVLVLIFISAKDLVLPSKDELLGLPVLGKEDDVDYRAAVAEGDRLYPNSPYIIQAPIPVVILPNSLIPKFGSLPETQISATKEIYRRALGQYTDLGTPMPEMFAAIKVDLTRHVRDFVPILQEEVKHGFESFIKFDEKEQWKAIPAFKTAKRLVAMLSACVFIGPPVSRDTTWVEAMYNYSDDLKETFLALERFPHWAWPLVHPFLFRFLKLNKRREMIEDKIRPMITQQPQHGWRARKAKFEDKYFVEDDNLEAQKTQKTLFGWVRERLGSRKADDVKLLARIQLRAAFASMDTVAHAVTNVIYDLAAYPEYVAPLREEIELMMGTAEITARPQAAMEKLDKMDSFIRESMRVNPMYLIDMRRVVTNPVLLEDGRVLPTGTHTAFSHEATHMRESHHFEGFRYSNLRAQEGVPNKFLFASTGNDHITFGHGRDSCPGRFFAAIEIKTIIAHLLLNYDIRLLPGTKRPENQYYNTTVAVDRKAEVLIKRRART